MMLLPLALAMFASDPAHAYVDPKCEGETQKFDDIGQQNYMLNYFALSSSMSPLHGPVARGPGEGAAGLEFAVLPPLSCEQRLVLGSTKTEDTNKSPVLPRPRVSYGFDTGGGVVPYVGFTFLPPLTIAGVRNLHFAGEAGVGVELDNAVQLGGRVHASVLRTVGEVATPFVEGDPAFDDLYLGSTLGLDFIAGYGLENANPYLSLGLTDVSTFFYVGDTAYVANNTNPYFGPTISLGSTARIGGEKRIELGGELYTATRWTYATEAIAEDAAGWNTTMVGADGADTGTGAWLRTARLQASYLFGG